MPARDVTPPLLHLSRDHCLLLLSTAQVGRLGLSVGALPVVLPVNYALIDETIVIRTTEGTKMDAALRHAVVAFEVDSYDPWGAWGWSVLVQGVAGEITDPTSLEHLSHHPLRAWAYGNNQPARYVGVRAERLSGRQFGQPPEWAADAVAGAPPMAE